VTDLGQGAIQEGRSQAATDNADGHPDGLWPKIGSRARRRLCDSAASTSVTSVIMAVENSFMIADVASRPRGKSLGRSSWPLAGWCQAHFSARFPDLKDWACGPQRQVMLDPGLSLWGEDQTNGRLHR
jgi:hypothetical protein